MKVKMLFGLFLVVLIMTGCAAAEHSAQESPSAQQVQDAANTPAPISMEPRIAKIDPTSLNVKVAAWGASMLGQGNDTPAALAIGPETALDASGVKDLPQDLRTALEAVRKANNKATLVVLYAGAQSSPSFTIGIDEVSVKQDVLKVIWGVNTPGETTGGSNVMAYPYVILTLDGVTLDLTKVELISR